ncbi:MAG TPA: sulfotransferase domain-containing protein, partial [Dehalococcoidia bacterium]|nr:sulfotransferase domain-containing protein [Dehalococcoidia bacterium]
MTFPTTDANQDGRLIIGGPNRIVTETPSADSTETLRQPRRERGLLAKAPAGALPTFVVGGTLRAATSSLYSFFGGRPDIGMSGQKEPHFFSFAGADTIRHGPYEDPSDIVTDLADYRSLFAHCATDPVRGECSSSYLYLAERAAPLLRELIPEARLIFVLRDPVERAYSHYRLQRLYGWEPAQTFEEALAKEEQRIAAGWLFPFHYRAIGNYAGQIPHYLEHFPREQIRFVRFERMVRDWPRVARELLDFIGADADAASIAELPRE